MTTEIDMIKAFVEPLPLQEQLQFWKLFRSKHRKRVASTEAGLCPDLMRALDDIIDGIRNQLGGAHG